MPAKPSYCRDLPAAIATLSRGDPSEPVCRLELEQALGVSKTVAWRLMRESGCARPGPGGALVCPRDGLIGRLAGLRDGRGRVAFEVQRRERLRSYLASIRPSVVASRTLIGSEDGAAQLVASRLASLPSNVALRPGRLEIDFAGSRELLEAIGAVVYALNNDFESIAQFLDGAPE